MTAPDPLVPAEVDLRGLEYMPLLGNHLFGSEFNAAATDAEWRAAVTLWWAAWNQVPAGSLPPDDTALCRLADLGRDLKAWRKVKARALHGFVACADGRLYHAFVCEQALVAWDKRVKERERKAQWRANKQGRDGDAARDKPPASRPQERGRDADVPADGNRRDVTGRDGTIENPERGTSTTVARAPDDDPPEVNGHDPTTAGTICRAMRAVGLASTNPGDPRLLALIEQGATMAEFTGIAAEAFAKGKGWAWVLTVVAARRSEAADLVLAPAVSNGHEAADRELRRSNEALARMEADRIASQSPESKRAAAAALARLRGAAA